MNKAQELIKKYNLAANSYYPNTKNPYQDRDKETDKLCAEKEAALMTKYRDRIGKGWYGFSFGSPTPLVWFAVIDEFIGYILEKNSVSEIRQVKMKMGGCRIGIFGLIDEEFDMCWELERVLFDEKLIY